MGTDGGGGGGTILGGELNGGGWTGFKFTVLSSVADGTKIGPDTLPNGKGRPEALVGTLGIGPCGAADCLLSACIGNAMRLFKFNFGFVVVETAPTLFSNFGGSFQPGS